MRMADLIPGLSNYHVLDPRQVKNLEGILGISRSFSTGAGIPETEGNPVTERTIVLESGHQPNFLPYPGVWKKAFLLDLLGRQLRSLGSDAVAAFGFADYNLSTASYLAQNQVPAFNKQGSENIGFRIPDRDRWKCFHTLGKPPEERFQAEIGKIEAMYLSSMSILRIDPEVFRDRMSLLTRILESSYSRARTFSDLNAFAFAGICSGILGLSLHFFRYTDVQKAGLFREASARVLTGLGEYNARFNALLAHAGPGIAPVTEDDIPFWYECQCGGKVRLAAPPSSPPGGTCPVCGREHRFPGGPGLIDLDGLYPRMSPNAVARNIIFSEGLGTSLFISGTGGGLRYGKLAGAISRAMGFHEPVTLAWRSADYYLGIAHRRALRELTRTFPLREEDVTDPSLADRIRDYRTGLERQIRDLRAGGGEGKAIQRLEGRLLNSSVQELMAKKVFTITPSMLDLFLACGPEHIRESWKTAAETAGIDPGEGQFPLMEGDILYPCGSGSPESTRRIHQAMKALEAGDGA